jgi:hypothetical protein
MKLLRLLLLLTLGYFTCAAHAQDTNQLKTQLGVFETKTGVVLVKGYEHIGNLNAADVVSVGIKESTDVSNGHKVYGLTIGLTGSGEGRERIYVDDEEVDALLAGIYYLIKIDYDVTTLPSFEASFATKSGLRICAHSLRREGGIQPYLQYCDRPKIALTSMQMNELYELIETAKKHLDALKAAK